MRTVLWLLACLALSTTPAPAGPNAGGVITVHHNAAVTYTADPGWIDGALAGSGYVHSEAPAASGPFPLPDDGQKVVWFAYALFPNGSQPRLKTVTFGHDFTPFANSTGVKIDWAEAEPGSSQQTTAGWPTQPNSGTSLVLSTTHTSLVTELYTFAGYGTSGQIYALRQHPTAPSEFGDDSIAALVDPIGGFGSMGFGVYGTPVWPVVHGACCWLDGTCVFTSYPNCQTGTWYPNVVCSPDLCPASPPEGACCDFATGWCEITTVENCSYTWLGENVPCSQYTCMMPELVGACCNPITGACFITFEAGCAYTWLALVPCSPNPCPPPIEGACCDPEGVCVVTIHADCAPPNMWNPEWTSCEPNPCEEPGGACCHLDGSCLFLHSDDCSTGSWTAGMDCYPNPCPQHGACCDVATADCHITTEDECDYVWLGVNVPCSPATCFEMHIHGACCNPMTGACLSTHAEDCTYTWLAMVPCTPNPCPPPAVGACCDPEGVCAVTTQGDCGEPSVWYPEWTSCEPNPCSPVPVERSTWGRIKARYQ